LDADRRNEAGPGGLTGINSAVSFQIENKFSFVISNEGT